MRHGLPGEIARVRLDADPAQVKTVGIPAGLNGRIGMQQTVAVLRNGDIQRLQLVIRQSEMPSLQGQRELCRTRTMSRIYLLIHALAVMQQGKQLDHEVISAGLVSEQQPVVSHTRPVRYAMNALPIQPEMRPQQSEKRTPFVAPKQPRVIVLQHAFHQRSQTEPSVRNSTKANCSNAFCQATYW